MRIDVAAKFLAVFGLLGILAGTPAQNPATPPKVKVTMVVILAGEDGTKIDAKLTAIAEEVRIKNPNLTNFRLGSMASKSLAVDEKALFPLVDDRTVAIT